MIKTFIFNTKLSRYTEELISNPALCYQLPITTINMFNKFATFSDLLTEFDYIATKKCDFSWVFWNFSS